MSDLLWTITQLREFFHRFSELLRFPKTHRDALDDFSRPLELNAVKNMFSSVLDILAEDAAEKLEDLRVVGAQNRRNGNPNDAHRGHIFW